MKGRPTASASTLPSSAVSTGEPSFCLRMKTIMAAKLMPAADGEDVAEIAFGREIAGEEEEHA